MYMFIQWFRHKIMPFSNQTDFLKSFIYWCSINWSTYKSAFNLIYSFIYFIYLTFFFFFFFALIGSYL